MWVYHVRLFEGEGTELDTPNTYFSAPNDVEAIRAGFRYLGWFLGYVGSYTSVTRITVASVFVGAIDQKGEPHTCVDRILYDSDDLESSLIQERPEGLVR